MFRVTTLAASAQSLPDTGVSTSTLVALIAIAALLVVSGTLLRAVAAFGAVAAGAIAGMFASLRALLVVGAALALVVLVVTSGSAEDSGGTLVGPSSAPVPALSAEAGPTPPERGPDPDGAGP